MRQFLRRTRPPVRPRAPGAGWFISLFAVFSVVVLLYWAKEASSDNHTAAGASAVRHAATGSNKIR